MPRGAGASHRTGRPVCIISIRKNSSTNRFSREKLEFIAEGVSMGRVFSVSPGQAAHISGIRVALMTVAVRTYKVRICHDLTNAVPGSSVNENTNTSAIPMEWKIGHVYLGPCCGGYCFCTLNSLSGAWHPPLQSCWRRGIRRAQFEGYPYR